MEPVSMTLGMLAATIYAKAQERLAEHAVDGGEGVLRRLVGWLRSSGRDSGDATIGAALDRVDRAPDSPSGLTELAAALDARAAADTAFGAQLAAILEELRTDAAVANFVTQIYGDAQVGKIVNINSAGDVSL